MSYGPDPEGRSSGFTPLLASHELPAVIADIGRAFEQRHPSATDASALLELYASISSLCVRATRVLTSVTVRGDVRGDATPGTIDRDTLSRAEARDLDAFHAELATFGEHLTSVNLAAIDLYYPGLRDELIGAMDAEWDLTSYYWSEEIAPRYGLQNKPVPSTLGILLDRYGATNYGPVNRGRELALESSGLGADDHMPARWLYRDALPTQLVTSDLRRIVDLLTACRDSLGAIVRENFRFTDLLPRRTDGRAEVEVNTYSISGGQVGAVGTRAQTHGQNLSQINTAGIDASELAAQLDMLRDQLAIVAAERDQYADLVAVSDAMEAARSGNATSALHKLTSVGHWALETATKIGVDVATEAIKRATGLT